VGITAQELLTMGRQPRFELLEVLLHGEHEPGIIRDVTRVGLGGRGHSVGALFHSTHGNSPNALRKRARPLSHSFSTLSWVRPMRRATSGKVKASRWRSTMTSR